MKKVSTTYWGLLAIVVIVIGLLGYRNFLPTGAHEAGEKVPCVNPALPVPDHLHIHSELEIMVEGQAVVIPANIGIEVTCHRVLHTHDATGVLHIEPNKPTTLTLADFFSLWEKPFSRDEILDCTAEKSDKDKRTREIKMSVDGMPSDEFENLILKDKQKIKIECAIFEASPKP